MAKPADLENLVALLIQRQKINGIIADYLSTTETTTQPLASSLDLAAGKRILYEGVSLELPETGGFLPTLETSGTPFTAVDYGVRFGIYQIVDGMCSGSGRIRTSSVTVGPATGTIRIGSLPAVPKAGNPSAICVITSSTTWLAKNPIAASISISAGTILLSSRTAFDGPIVDTMLSDLNPVGTANDIEFFFQFEV